MTRGGKTLACVFQARLESTRVERKMTRPFAGSSLLELGLRKAARCRNLDHSRIFLSACEEEIISIGRRAGVKIYPRSLASISETVTPREIWKYAFDIESDYFLVLSPCNPMLSAETIDRAIETFMSSDYPSLFSVVRRPNFYFNKDSQPVNRFLGDQKHVSTLDTKKIEPLYEAAHSIYIYSAEYMRKNLAYWSFTKNDPYLFEIPPEEAFDIDYLWQFELAEAMVLRRDAAAAGQP